MKQFVESFENYYKRKKSFERGLIDFLLKQNPQITKTKYKLKQIKDEDLKTLDRYFKEIDGTLLVDLISRFIKEHKIFK